MPRGLAREAVGLPAEPFIGPNIGPAWTPASVAEGVRRSVAWLRDHDAGVLADELEHEAAADVGDPERIDAAGHITMAAEPGVTMPDEPHAVVDLGAVARSAIADGDKGIAALGEAAAGLGVASPAEVLRGQAWAAANYGEDAEHDRLQAEADAVDPRPMRPSLLIAMPKVHAVPLWEALPHKVRTCYVCVVTTDDEGENTEDDLSECYAALVIGDMETSRRVVNAMPVGALVTRIPQPGQE